VLVAARLGQPEGLIEVVSNEWVGELVDRSIDWLQSMPCVVCAALPISQPTHMYVPLVAEARELLLPLARLEARRVGLVDLNARRTATAIAIAIAGGGGLLCVNLW
jgi:hypothetical protein